MKFKIFSGLILILLLVSSSTQAFNFQIVEAEPSKILRMNNGTSRSSMEWWSDATIRAFQKMGLDRWLIDDFQLPFEVGGGWGFDSEVKRSDLAYVDDYTSELVIGLSDLRPNGYSELMDLIVSDGGKFVSSVSMDGKVAALVAEMPYDVLSSFIWKVKTTGLGRYIEPNIRLEIDFFPNDPDWSNQWGPQKIEVDSAWNMTLGDPSILVAIVDTGIDWNHPDLADNYVPLGYDWVNNDPDPMDDHGHGTHCAGVIAAVANNSVGIAGLAQVRIMAEKCLDESGSGSSSDVARAIIHAVDQGADIISCSLGSYRKNTLLYESVRYAHERDVLVVAAAGNDAIDSKHFPAAYDEVLAITATDQNDAPASFTNFGFWVKVAAPGVDIYSTIWDDSYAYASGTSMAAPHVSGVAALIWSQFPNMTRDQVWAQLQNAVDDLGNPGFDVYYGFGRINARKAVEQAPAEHDALALNWETPSYMSIGSTGIFNTTILNMGTSHESDLVIDLLVNGSIVDSTSVDFLASGLSTFVSNSWKPLDEGIYNVTSYIEPVIGETIINNNALSTQMAVRVPQVIRVPDDFDTIQKAIDAALEGDTVFVASGIYSENIWVDKEDLNLVGEDQRSTIIDGEGKADVVLVTADSVRINKFTLKNSMSSLTYSGLTVIGAEGAAVSEVTTLDNYHGMFLWGAANVTLRNNNMTNNTYNFGVNADGLEGFIHDIDRSNIVDGKPLYYWINAHNEEVPSDAGFVAIVNSTNIIVKNLSLTNNFNGLLIAYTRNSLVENINASTNYHSIYLAHSNNSMVRSNNPIGNYAGIFLLDSKKINIENNTLKNNENGISLHYSKGNNIILNLLLNNDDGLFLEKSDDNTVSHNILSNNTNGVIIQRSGNNTLKDNVMTANLRNFGVTGNHLLHFIQDIDISNTVDEKPVYYLINQIEKEIPSDAGYVAMVNSTSISARCLNLINNIQGVLLAFTSNSIIENVTVMNNRYGIYLHGSHNNTIVNISVTSARTRDHHYNRGIQLVTSNNNVISNNLISNSYIGLGLWSSVNNAINWNTIANSTEEGNGLYLVSSDNNIIGNNTITNNDRGTRLYYSSMNTLRENNMTNNSYNFGVFSLSLSDYSNDVDTSNTINGKPIYYWINQRDKQVPTNAGYIALINSTGIIIKNQDLSENGQGILFAYTTKSVVTGVKVSHNNDGIYLWHSDNNNLTKTNIEYSSWDGIGLYYSNNNTISQNRVENNDYGILTYASQFNYIGNNLALNNNIGIHLYWNSHNSTIIMNKVIGGTSFLQGLAGIALTGATYNLISENIVSENQFFIGAGIYLEWSSNDNTIAKNVLKNNSYGFCVGYWGLYGLSDQNNNNTIYYNNLLENTVQVLSLNSINTWDYGYPFGGNYWSDYVGVDLNSGPGQNTTDGDGIGDTPYIIDEENQDNYPLMHPYGLLGDVNGDGTVDIEDILLAIEAFGSTRFSSRWNTKSDLNEDDIIDIIDIVILIRQYGKSV